MTDPNHNAGAQVQLLLKNIREQLQANRPVSAFIALEQLKDFLSKCTITEKK